MKPQILIVDDEEEFTETLAERLKMRDFDVVTASSGEEAVAEVQDYNFDVVILDVAMPGMSGNETLQEIKRLKPLTEVIMLTGHATVESAIEGLKFGSFDYLKKPCDTDELVEKLKRAHTRKSEQEERIREARVKEILLSPRTVLRDTGGPGAPGVAPAVEDEAAATTSAHVTPDTALKKLMAGNKRHVDSRPAHPNSKRKRMGKMLEGQHPFAVILGCSDSRVPPEIVFDQGLGDLFVIRVAGNVFDDMVLGSIEYAAGHLNTPLVMVLGHSGCGAVEAATGGDEPEGALKSIVSAIKPAVDNASKREKDLVDRVARANALLVVERLKKSSAMLTELVDMGRLKIVPAFCDLKTGKVEIIA